MGPTETSARRAAVGRAVASAAVLVCAAVAVGGVGCGPERQETRAPRLAAERFLDALGRDDLASLRSRATCVVPSEAIVGGVVLRVETTRSVPLGALDSLARSAAAGHRALDSLWAIVPEAAADSLFRRSQLFARRNLLYRNALRAASLSLDGEEMPGTTMIRTCRIRARIRYEGPLVGPKPVDREHVLRLLAAPGGRWIVFSAFLREDDPKPEPI